MLLKDKHIFIVEDNVQNRVVFQFILGKHGALVEFERWGKDAIWRLESRKVVDLIVLDLMLAAGISGYDICDEIRRIPRFDNTPIVAVSASDPVIAIPKVQQRGFAGFIAKPIDDLLFPQQLAMLINGEKVWYAVNI
jgi:two-component system, chemotaxis family, sensor kinase CheA